MYFNKIYANKIRGDPRQVAKLCFGDRLVMD